MLLIFIQCQAIDCEGSVRFESPGRSRSGRIAGRCDACGALYDLYGGEMRRFEVVGSTSVPERELCESTSSA